MPDLPKGVIEVDVTPDIPSPINVKALHNTSIARSFPGSPGLPGNKKTTLRESNSHSGVEIQIDRQSYREAYANHVMSGIVGQVGGDFPEVDMDYGTTDGTDSLKQPPNLEEAQPADGDDSTIASSGLGPNVATLDITSPENPGAGISVVEVEKVGGPAFVGTADASPHITSKKISDRGLYGGPGPADAGTLGESGID